MTIYKLLGGLLFTIVVTVLGPYILAYFDLGPPLSNKAWFVLLITVVGLAVKILVGDVAGGEFLWHKFGYDNCIMVFAGLLTAFSVQLFSNVDLFEGLKYVTLIKDIPPFFSDDADNRKVQLFAALLVALVG